MRYAVRGDGPPLVFVHGTPFSSYVWHRIAPHFIASHRVYYFDLLGYGQSEKIDGDVSLGVQNELLARLLDTGPSSSPTWWLTISAAPPHCARTC